MKLHRFFKIFVSLNILCPFVAACQIGIPREALMLSPESLQNRQLQTRVFETNDEMQLLTASAAVLQDLGFTIDESEVKCGVIVSSRDRDIHDPGEIALKAIAAFFTWTVLPHDTHQKVLASLVTRPVDKKRTAVRITFQHMVWQSDQRMVKNEQINDPEIYQEFFSKLSKSVFLTAHEI